MAGSHGAQRPSAGVSAELVVQGADATDALRIARSLTPADPGDPRFTDPAGSTPSAPAAG